MAVKTKAEILSEIATLLADNTAGDISALDVRTVVNDITDSYENLITAGTVNQYWRGDKTWQTFPTSEVSGTLTSAQINGLDTTPITLLGTPGANKYYIIEDCSFHYKAGSLAYAVTGYPIIAYNNGLNSGGILVPITEAILESTTSKIINSIPEFETTGGYVVAFSYPTNIINTAIIIKMSNEGTISTGDGTINYSIKYRIVTTS